MLNLSNSKKSKNFINFTDFKPNKTYNTLAKDERYNYQNYSFEVIYVDDILVKCKYINNWEKTSLNKIDAEFNLIKKNCYSDTYRFKFYREKRKSKLLVKAIKVNSLFDAINNGYTTKEHIKELINSEKRIINQSSPINSYINSFNEREWYLPINYNNKLDVIVDWGKNELFMKGEILSCDKSHDFWWVDLEKLKNKND